ncbi:MAG: dTDP-glucose 4,6-dehydratase [Thermodesulfovibrionales bacterium]|nr:dTDP-glucose 4,6-dehydratase [Thermodesulfovibrionales bacterium]
MKLLVTGGAGFIGSEFVRQGVRKGYAITVLDKLSYAGDRERLREVDQDIVFSGADIADRRSVEDLFRKTKPDAVVHWAAESHVDRSIQDASPFIEANVRGTQVLLDVCRISQVKKFINVSTDEVYGDLGEEGQFSESTPLNPSSPYSVSKASADMLGRAYQRTYGIPVLTVRPSNNYGPWQYPEKLIPVVVLKAVNNEKVPVYARGENVREWLHVSDCASAVFNILEKGKAGEVYNIGSGQEKRNIEVVKTILRILGKPEKLIAFVEDRPGHDFRYSLNSNRMRTEFGWAPGVTFEQGIEHTVKWYLEHMEWTLSKMQSKH